MAKKKTRLCVESTVYVDETIIAVKIIDLRLRG